MPDPDDLKIDRAFAIFVSPSLDEGEEGMWNVRIVGPGLDNMTCASNPVDAVGMAHDLLQLITGTCGFPADPTGHDFSKETFFDGWVNGGMMPVPALECTKCGTSIRKQNEDDSESQRHPSEES